MPYFVNYSNFALTTNTFLTQGVSRNLDGFNLSFAMITPEFPAYIRARIDSVSRIDFKVNDFLDIDGTIKNHNSGECIPLIGLSACWTPNSSSVLSDLLRKYYDRRKSEHLNTNNDHDVKPINRGYREIESSEIIKLIKEKKVLIFTGAGISIASGIPDLEGLISLQQEIFHHPEQFFQDIVSNQTSHRIEKAKQFHQLITASEPNNNHWYIAQLCKKYGFALATGNIDGLHEKTQLTPIYQTSPDKVEIPNIEQYDVILTIGLSNEGMGKVAEEYRIRNANGRIIAINVTPPAYLGSNDFYLEGNTEEILYALSTMEI